MIEAVVEDPGPLVADDSQQNVTFADRIVQILAKVHAQGYGVDIEDYIIRTEPFGIYKPAISRHLKVLETANLIVRKKDAQWHIFQLRSESLKAASDWIARYRKFWEDQFDAMLS